MSLFKIEFQEAQIPTICAEGAFVGLELFFDVPVTNISSQKLFASFRCSDKIIILVHVDYIASRMVVGEEFLNTNEDDVG